ncbi:MAG: lipoprotein-releasing system ATP-binding protein LolD [Spirochaetae bacterium HGW-Spirochaetae-3]|jgi:lipoprotein-releasing system ATP-binding protein|nr:MAG: lipoprotein-releasing system ATP-binding protein LolD [Spirochaetae bacterium HGW-Spirochaetae-3]
MSEDVIVCGGVRKVFRSEAEDLQILRGVDLRLERGACASITGPSGCGKSTFLSILGGLDRPSGGDVSVGGVDLVRAGDDELSAFRARVVGFVFQFHYLLKDFTALENAMLPAYMLTGDRKAAIDKARPLLEAVGLGDRLSHVPAKLSGGERQRVAIARALVNDPEIVLADEPTGNLDRASAGAVEDLLFDLAASHGTTLLVVTHDPGMAGRASRRFVLRDGELVES